MTAFELSHIIKDILALISGVVSSKARNRGKGFLVL